MIKEIYRTGSLKLWSHYKDKLREKPLLSYLFWESTMNCNFHCKHCGSSAGNKVYKNDLTTEEIKNAFKEIAENFEANRIMIAVMGGEPLLRKDLFEVMSYARDLGFNWGMVTNGYLVTQEIVDDMKASGMSSIVVSIDDIGERHDKFREVSGAYNRAVNAVKLLKQNEFNKLLQVTTTVSKQNIEHLEELYALMLDLGIDSWRVNNVDPIGRAEHDENMLLDKKQFKYLFDFIKEKRKEKKIDVTYSCSGFLGLDYEKEVRSYYFYCETGINIASILHNGDIYVCPNVPRRKELIQGNVKTDSFSEIWNNKFEYFRDKNRTKCDKCEKCDHWQECLGGAMHLWDFEKKQPKFCHYEVLNS